MKKWKFCSSVSLIVTGFILTVALYHKDDYTVLLPQIAMYIGIVLHIKIAHQDFKDIFNEIVMFLIYSSIFLIAILLLIQLHFSENLLCILMFSIFSGLFLLISIRYFINFCYTFLCNIRRVAATRKQKTESVMWIVTFLSAIATISSVPIAFFELFFHS